MQLSLSEEQQSSRPLTSCATCHIRSLFHIRPSLFCLQVVPVFCVSGSDVKAHDALSDRTSLLLRDSEAALSSWCLMEAPQMVVHSAFGFQTKARHMTGQVVSLLEKQVTYKSYQV